MTTSSSLAIPYLNTWVLQVKLKPRQTWLDCWRLLQSVDSTFESLTARHSAVDSVPDFAISPLKPSAQVERDSGCKGRSRSQRAGEGAEKVATEVISYPRKIDTDGKEHIEMQNHCTQAFQCINEL
eukprot:751317-Hanusia_phi.AAC.11